ncbi:transporter substrate-binding domain-containing protein [Calidifontibacter sp. DB0510]|uniref:Transporter substrate-binding domain-containing protein n=1 Tax=Metallococcus carri TaxID=1656884 RepID=A0A967EBP6_9MICO|nr:transporter substrate-binding domain-containing protein [Metallococcus carri]NHN57184.1 transporter substrate-binding domain-containing protein [Metallococcus carri]NOP38013.1 transporter substrate-binding domain-containing protein [Calidifontibacter sp. DB2511S]
MPSPLLRRAAPAVATVFTLATLAGCGSNSPDSSSQSGAPGGSANAVAAVQINSAARKLLPADVQSSQQLTLGATRVTGTSALPHTGIQDGKEVGLDIDLRAAVAKSLGITWKVQTGTFPTIVPGVQNGKYQVGQANFGVTKERLKIVDFATYLNDGQAFVGSKQVKVQSVTKLSDVCGLKIATGSGTTFQKLLETHKNECAAQGKQPYTVQYFSDNAPIYLGLQNGKIDAYFGPTLSLKVLVKKLDGTRFLGQVTQTPVGFITAKGSPIAPALIAAINGLIKDGTYAKIFAKWGVPFSAIKQSQLNPRPTF